MTRPDGRRQGEILDWVSPRGPRRVLVVSSDSYNASGAPPVVVRIVRSGDGSPYLVPLAEPDPVGGRVVVGSIGAVSPADIRGGVGMVSGATWDRVSAALRLLMEL